MESLDTEGLIAVVNDGAIVIDLRPPTPPLRDRIPGSLSLTLDAARRGDVPDVPLDASLVVVCEWGRLSELAGLYLEAHGFTRVAHFRGGMAALRAVLQKPPSATDAKPGTESR